MSEADRLSRVDAADALCAAAFTRATEGPSGPAPACERGLALVAVGGYGRRELAPASDLDVVLVHGDDLPAGTVAHVAEELFYPLWDAGADVDHAVRSLAEAAEAAAQDLRVALGLLDARHVAGDRSVTLRLRTTSLAQWRRAARARVPELHAVVERRVTRVGELAQATVPDLKESGGGLRDAAIMRALVATWLVEVPHTDLERARRVLLDTRDALHEVTGRRSDRLAPELWPDLAAALGDPEPAATQRRVREAGRRLTHLSRLTWRRVHDVLEPRPSARRVPGPASAGRSAPAPGPMLTRIGNGLAVAGGEVVVEQHRHVDPAPTLVLRVAAEAAERDLVLSPQTIARLLRECPEQPDPWPRRARELLVRLLGAGPGLLPVWETLDETGALDRLLPEWDRVRLLPHATLMHRFTVDRHLVETCLEASRLMCRVRRPDLLLVAGLLHDLGKGGVGDHSVSGAPLAASLARRLGFADADAETVGALVRWHLLLAETATTRDLDDPATLELVLVHVPDRARLELLAALTEADARATSAKAWSPWRAGLVQELVRRVDAAFEERSDPVDPPAPGPAPAICEELLQDSCRADVRVEKQVHGTEVTLACADRPGALASVAGALALMRVPVRAARAWSEGGVAVSRWQVAEEHLDAAVLRTQVEAVLAGRRDPTALLPAASAFPEPVVVVRPEASRRATVLEVRVEDRPGLVHLVARTLSALQVAVCSAHVTTIGPLAVDVFYLQEEGAGALSDVRAAQAAHAVRAAVGGPATLDA